MEDVDEFVEVVTGGPDDAAVADKGTRGPFKDGGGAVPARGLLGLIHLGPVRDILTVQGGAVPDVAQHLRGGAEFGKSVEVARLEVTNAQALGFEYRFKNHSVLLAADSDHCAFSLRRRGDARSHLAVRGDKEHLLHGAYRVRVIQGRTQVELAVV